MADISSAGGQKRALLFGCPVGSLRGVGTDLDIMESVLGKYGFTSTKWYRARRADIITAWDTLIQHTKAEDAVVIYYSGHGGLADKTTDESDKGGPQRLQFLIPVDFEETKEGDWRGITDAELSRLIGRTTNITENVTIILDCCHSARMARRQGVVKTIDPGDYREVFKHLQKMMGQGDFDAHLHYERNPRVVSVAAAAETEYAYEQDFRGEEDEVRMSVLTEALSAALRPQTGQGADEPPRVSWRSVMLRIRDRMKVTCPQQYPQVEGDDLRFVFDLTKADLYGAVSISRLEDSAVLRGGTLHGLSEGDEYGVFPFGEERMDPKKMITKVVVTEVGPAVSMARFEGTRIPELGLGARAFPVKKALGQLPVAVRGSDEFADRFRTALKKAKFLRVADKNDRALLATVTYEPSRLLLQTSDGDISFGLAEWLFKAGQKSDSEIAKCIARLESLARSRHVLTLEGELGADAISEQVDLELGLVKGGLSEPLSEKTLVIGEGERFYVKIKNVGDTKVYVSIFDACADVVSLLSKARPGGRALAKGETYTFGEVDTKTHLKGAEISWPAETLKLGEIPETIIVVVADNELDNLSDLETDWKHTRRSRPGARGLANLINDLATRRRRTVAPESQETGHLRYGVRRFFFRLKPTSPPPAPPPVGSARSTMPIQDRPPSLGHERTSQGSEQDEEHSEVKQPSVRAAELPASETITEDGEPVSDQAGRKGFLGAIARTAMGVPSCIWVVNQHVEEITVVVSTYRPNLLLTGGGINASATGAGLDINATTFLSPVTKKILTPEAADPERAKATFPLWTRSEAFGVISIFTGPDKALYIENDRVPLGATAYFINKPDLTIVPYDERVK